MVRAMNVFANMALPALGLCAAMSPYHLDRRSNFTDVITTTESLELSSDTSFDYELLSVMSLATGGGADIGDVLLAAKNLVPGDIERYSNVLAQIARRAYSIGQTIDVKRFPVSARDFYFKTSSYFRSADFYLRGNWSDPRINQYYDIQSEAFYNGTALLENPGKRLALQADGFIIPAVLYRPGGPAKVRPTLILSNGYDGGLEDLYHLLGVHLLERGYNVLTYEGPGQPGPRRKQDLGFILEWEKVVTPIVDYLYTLPDVDTDAIGLLGFSFGGFLVPRVAAFEHRLAAVICLDGIYDFGESLFAQFPLALREIYDAGNASTINTIVNSMLSDPTTPTNIRWGITQGLWSFKKSTAYEFLQEATRYTLANVSHLIQTPVFVGDAESEIFFKGQPALLKKTLGDRATYHLFENSDAAGPHCGAGAMILTNQVIWDWFENVIAEKKHS